VEREPTRLGLDVAVVLPYLLWAVTDTRNVRPMSSLSTR
jgi:hypothetical protein